MDIRCAGLQESQGLGLVLVRVKCRQAQERQACHLCSQALTAVMKELFRIWQYFTGFILWDCVFLMEAHSFVQQAFTEQLLCGRHNLKCWA